MHLSRWCKVCWQQRSSETKEKGERSAKVKENKDKYNSSSEDSARESEGEIDYEETEASCIVKCNDNSQDG